MAFYWNPYSIPELEHLPKEERKRIWKTAWKGARNRWEIIIAALMAGGLPWAGMFLLERWHVPKVFRFLLLVICVIGAQLVYAHWQISFLRPRIWAQIPGLCGGCGYDIRATPQRCPECGRALAQNVGSS